MADAGLLGVSLILVLAGLLFRRRRLVWTGLAVLWFSSTPFVSRAPPLETVKMFYDDAQKTGFAL